MIFIEVTYLPSNVIIANVALCEFGLNFKDQTLQFQVAILTKDCKMQTLPLQSYIKSGIYHQMAPLRMLYNLDLHVQGHEF